MVQKIFLSISTSILWERRLPCFCCWLQRPPMLVLCVLQVWKFRGMANGDEIDGNEFVLGFPSRRPSSMSVFTFLSQTTQQPWKEASLIILLTDEEAGSWTSEIICQNLKGLKEIWAEFKAKQNTLYKKNCYTYTFSVQVCACACMFLCMRSCMCLCIHMCRCVYICIHVWRTTYRNTFSPSIM